jgi:hypothetical protein
LNSPDFEGPLDSPIVLLRSTGAEIVGNHISGIVPLLLFFGKTEIEGFFVSGFDFPPNAITGKVRIADNVIEVSGGDFVNVQFDEVSADIEVGDNTVRFLDSNGIVQTFGILVLRSHGKVDVINNVVEMAPGNPDVFPIGILVGGHAEASYQIRSNTVTTEHPNYDGIDVFGLSDSDPTQHAIVVDNNVRIQSSLSTAAGIGFDGAVKTSLIAGNKIEGTSGNAIQILGLSSSQTAESNRAAGNDISALSASTGDVFFGLNSINNLFAGQCNTYVDLGTGNRILCGHAVGSVVNAAGVANRLGPAMDLVGNIHRARGDAMRYRLN